MPYPKRLIEVDLPIKRISAHARREKSIRHGHISTLHIWWARRPLAACRAVLCASLWPDPADPLCPKEFIEFAKKEMLKWSDNDHLQLLSKESIEHFMKVNHDKKIVDNKIFLRQLLLDFIADFSNWNNSNQPEYFNTSRALTNSAHIALGGQEGTRPLVVDPFAGGGSIPLEALRIGADAFASDLNPIPVLLNKMQLEYIPKHGRKLVDEVRKWGQWLRDETEKEVGKFYKGLKEPIAEYFQPQIKPTIKRGLHQWKFKRIVEETPLAFLWARTIKCEGPGCGAEVPILRSAYLAKKGTQSIGFKIIPNKKEKKVDFEIIVGIKSSDAKGTVQRGNVSCPCCGFVTPVKNIRTQLKEKNGGSRDSKLLCVVSILKTERNCNKQTDISDEKNRFYRIPRKEDFEKLKSVSKELDKIIANHPDEIPQEEIPLMSGVFNVPIYGIDKWELLFNQRQLFMVLTMNRVLKTIQKSKFRNQEIFLPAKILLAFLIDKVMDKSTTLCRWKSTAEYMAGNTFGRQALPIVFDYCEANVFGEGTGDVISELDWICKVLEHIILINESNSTVEKISASNHILPDDSCDYFFTDPPYYNAVPYSDLSDFFYVWLKKNLQNDVPDLFKETVAPKKDEICEMKGWDPIRYPEKDGQWFENNMTLAMNETRRYLKPSGIGIVVFAHKTTSGWEAQLQAMMEAGLIFTASWPIDTEMGARLRAQGSAALASSVHLVCRPRENEDGSLIQNQIGDWRDVQEELPKRIHEWMPRLAAEGVAGADAIFACLGPALEVFSRYSSVEKPNGDVVTLREYLEKVWAAVSQEALNMVFTGGEAQGLEEDARLTAMWLWTLTAGASDNGADEDDGDGDDEESSSGGKLTGGFTLEYDTARKIAQGLGANLEDLKTLVEVKGDKARLLPVIERTSKLFGSAGIQQQPVKKKKKVQLSFSFENVEPEAESKFEMPELKVEQTGKTVLDRLHQAMLLFSTGRTEALKRFLVEDGAGKDDRFWKLAQSLTSLYPKDTDERRWVEAVQTYKKSLGF